MKSFKIRNFDTSNEKQNSNYRKHQRIVSPPPLSVTPIEIFTQEHYTSANVDNKYSSNRKSLQSFSKNSRPIHRVSKHHDNEKKKEIHNS